MVQRLGKIFSISRAKEDAADSIHDLFGYSAPAATDYWGSRGHSLNHHRTERLRLNRGDDHMSVRQILKQSRDIPGKRHRPY